MRVLYLGDIVGRSGRTLVLEKVPELREQLKLDLVVVNGENAASGFGITRKICDQLLEIGVDAITTGNHVWDQKETAQFISQEKRLDPPHQFPQGYARHRRRTVRGPPAGARRW